MLSRIEDEAGRVAAAICGVLAEQPDAKLTWTGRTVSVAGFPTHLRSEDALHRWDLVGDDETSWELLSQQVLLDHAITFVGRPMLTRGLHNRTGTESFLARVRCVERPDLVVEVDDGQGRLAVKAPEGDPTIVGDPAARLLLLWGRKPAPFTRLQAADVHAAGLVQALLSGY